MLTGDLFQPWESHFLAGVDFFENNLLLYLKKRVGAAKLFFFSSKKEALRLAARSIRSPSSTTQSLATPSGTRASTGCWPTSTWWCRLGPSSATSGTCLRCSGVTERTPSTSPTGWRQKSPDKEGLSISCGELHSSGWPYRPLVAEFPWTPWLKEFTEQKETQKPEVLIRELPQCRRLRRVVLLGEFVGEM